MPRVMREGLDGTVYVTRNGLRIGSGFLVGYPDDPTADDPIRAAAVYVVTARHVVMNRDGLGVQLNGVAGLVDLPAPDWWESEDDSADIAVAYLPPSKAYDRHMFDIEEVVDNEWMAEELEIGDTVATIGLFSRAPGTDRIRPVVRFGNVSLMNEEPLPAELNGLRYDLDAIMVEMTSWPGQSGSVAIVLHQVVDSKKLVDGRVILKLVDNWAVLGVVSGHWDLPASLAADLDREGMGVDLGEAQEAKRVRVNAGIALVIPGQHLIDLLNREDIVKDRNRRRAVERGDNRPKPAAQMDSNEPPAPEFTRREFEDALRKVSRRKPSQPAE